MTRLTLRHLTAADIRFADSLRATAGWNQTFADWQRFIDLSPRGCLIAECEGRPVATGTTISYGKELAWIGMILVHPDYRRRGIATVLLKHCIEILRAAGIKSIKLDATPEGRPVYEKLGFVPEYNLIRYRVPASAGTSSDSMAIRAIETTDLALILALDQSAIGANRDELLKRLISESPRALLYEDAGQITGFGLLRNGSRATYLGPIISTNPTHASSLADALVANANSEMFCDLPDNNRHATAWARGRNLAPQRILTRMYLGQNLQPSQSESLFAITSPDMG